MDEDNGTKKLVRKPALLGLSDAPRVTFSGRPDSLPTEEEKNQEQREETERNEQKEETDRKVTWVPVRPISQPNEKLEETTKRRSWVAPSRSMVQASLRAQASGAELEEKQKQEQEKKLEQEQREQDKKENENEEKEKEEREELSQNSSQSLPSSPITRPVRPPPQFPSELFVNSDSSSASSTPPPKRRLVPMAVRHVSTGDKPLTKTSSSPFRGSKGQQYPDSISGKGSSPLLRSNPKCIKKTDSEPLQALNPVAPVVTYKSSDYVSRSSSSGSGTSTPSIPLRGYHNLPKGPNMKESMINLNFSDIQQTEEEPLIKRDQVLFLVHDNPHNDVDSSLARIQHVKDIYRLQFQTKPHFIYYGALSEQPTQAINIVCVMKEAVDCRYRAIRIDKRGHYEFSIAATDFEGKRKDTKLKLLILECLTTKFPNMVFQLIKDNSFARQIMSIEQKHSQNPSAFKVAFLYSKGGEQSIHDFFANMEASPKYWEFLDKIQR
eukprot:TRINITY_DN1305_c0_g1_i1.p1 TRINITY_DN1305_c0_g1~~TRINITY_DN1305_c0_g1_i1.p1  ORF type:complete len:494 (-),score=98.38 TRINITY_DN1305_c0_g1_i1:526-2007(-)